MNLPPPTLAPWPDGTAPPDVLVVAGERSGDEHAARLIRELRARRPELRVAALGGPALKEAGAHLLYDLTAHAVVGLVEVLKNYGFFKELFAQTLAWIEKYQPRAVLLVDYPGFNLRLAKALFQRGRSRRAGGPLRMLYYISPQIWAWKSGRRFTMAKHLDALAVIFPFEPACFADTKLPVEFVGHPFAAADCPLPVRYDVNGPVLLLPGSRVAAASRIFPAMLHAFAYYQKVPLAARAAVLCPSPAVRAVLDAALARRPEVAPHITIHEPGEVLAGSMVLTSSGTMSLQCALAGIPGAIVYRTNPLTYLVGRSVVSVPYLGIANLLLGRDAWPEFIQGDAKPGPLARQLLKCQSPSAREQAAADAAKLRALLGEPAAAPDAAAHWLEKNLFNP